LETDKIVTDTLTVGAGGTIILCPLVVTRTWDGGSIVNNLWTTNENWVGDLAPHSGDNLVFPAGAKQMENVNDYPMVTVFGSITVSGSGYCFHNGGVPTTSVQVAPGAQLETDKIVTDTLTVGAGSVIMLSPIPGGPLAGTISNIVDAVSETSASDPPAPQISPEASNSETIQALKPIEPSQPVAAVILESPPAPATSSQIEKPVEPSQPLVVAIEETPLALSTIDTQEIDATVRGEIRVEDLPEQAPGLNDEHDIIRTAVNSSQIRDFLFSQPHKEVFVPTAFSDLAKNDLPGKSSGAGSGNTSKASLVFADTLMQYHRASQAVFSITAARDTALQGAAHGNWYADWLWNDDLEKPKKRQNADSHQAMPLLLDSILLQ
jgi:hypothetical protein